MSHQTGIRSNQQLRQFIATRCKNVDSSIRVLKVVIGANNDELVLDTYKETTSADWKSDYAKYVTSMVDIKQPCFIFFRLDESKVDNYLWLFISWSPDMASVRDKMLYAATKSTLKMEFGTGDHIKDELFCTNKDEITLDGYLKHLKSQLAPKPLTVREEELELIKQSEHSARINVDSKHKTLQGVMFPIDDQASVHLQHFQTGNLNYLQLYIDIKNERILLGCAKDRLRPNELDRETPKDNGRFHLYRYVHTYDNQECTNIVFIYTMPGSGSSIKERMLYSSCKNELIAYLKQVRGLVLAKTFETSDMAEITESYLLDELHPRQQTTASKFDKPKGPIAARGPRRIVK